MDIPPNVDNWTEEDIRLVTGMPPRSIGRAKRVQHRPHQPTEPPPQELLNTRWAHDGAVVGDATVEVFQEPVAGDVWVEAAEEATDAVEEEADDAVEGGLPMTCEEVPPIRSEGESISPESLHVLMWSIARVDTMPIDEGDETDG
jgi:hypothetical protein